MDMRKRGDAFMAAHANLLDKNIKKNMIQMALPLMLLNLINSLGVKHDEDADEE